MKRDIYKKLSEWKASKRRKPLLLQGARQTGKTYIIKKFGGNEYEKIFYCNFEEDPHLNDFFKRDLKPKRILTDISTYYGDTIRANSDLLVFDEIQLSNNALTSLKYFQEEKNDIHVIGAGSLLGVKLSEPGSFPVGKVNLLKLFPMTFPEFLNAIGKIGYRYMLENIKKPTPLPDAIHNDLIALLKKYYFAGGMPEAVKCFVETGNSKKTRQIQEEIIKSYVMDFAKHAPVPDIPKLTALWNSIPKHLARENKKFVFSAVKKGARARGYENGLMWLKAAGLIYKVKSVETAKHPLAHYSDASCFKIYALDVGLLGAMAQAPAELQTHGQSLFEEYKGAFVENYAAQQFAAHFERPLYYWRSKGGKAEIDFLSEFKGEVFPIEVKSGVNAKSKSLRSYDLQFSPNTLIRTTLLNFKQDGKILNLPLYALSLSHKFIGE
ncbi:MAG: ATP-binding protein [Deltaproteobacteria bacterium]|nr:ATP-binding protein [Deltaproteobacteria bacterium]